MNALVASIYLWVLAGLRLLLLVSPLLACLYTLGNSNPMASCVLMVMWSLPTSKSLLANDSQVHIVADGCITVLVALKTLEVMKYAESSAEHESFWLLPLLAWVAHTGVVHLQSNSLPDSTPLVQPENAVRYNRIWWNMMTSVIVISGVMDALTMTSGEYSTLAMGEVAASGVLMIFVLASDQDTQSTDVWLGGSTLVLTWLFLEACMLPIMDSDQRRPIRVVVMVTVLLASLAMAEPAAGSTRPSIRQRIGKLVQTAVDLVKLVLGSVVPYQVAAIACVAFLVMRMDMPWWTARVGMPPKLASFCRTALGLIDNAVRQFYEFTNQPDLQKILASAGPEVAALRGAIFRVVKPSYEPLLIGRDGKFFTLIPMQSLLAIGSFALGPLVVATGILVQVFPSGQAFVRSRWFWAYGMVTTSLFLFLTQLVSGASITFFYWIFGESTYDRTYTLDGQYAILAQLVLCGCCLCMFVVCMVQESAEVVAVRKAIGLSSKPAAEPGPIQATKRAVDAIITYVTSPSLVLMGVAVFLLVTTVSSTGSPIQTFEVYKLEPTTPPWLKSTTVDKLSQQSSSVYKMLNFEARLALLTAALVEYSIQKIHCWECKCMPIPNGDFFSGVGSSVSGFFGHRRLLEQHFDMSELPPGRELVFVNESSPLARRLMSTTECGTSCGSQYKLCVFDIIGDLVMVLEDLFIKGFGVAMDVVVNGIIAKLPLVHIIDALMLQLAALDLYRDFDIFDPKFDVSFSFRLEFFGLDFGLIPMFKVPSMPSGVTSGTIVALVLVAVLVVVLLYKMDILEGAMRSAVAGVELTITTVVVPFILSVGVFLYILRDQLRTLGYDVNITMSNNAYTYGIAMALIFMAAFLKVGEASADDLEALGANLNKGMADVKKKMRLLTTSPPVAQKQPAATSSKTAYTSVSLHDRP